MTHRLSSCCARRSLFSMYLRGEREGQSVRRGPLCCMRSPERAYPIGRLERGAWSLFDHCPSGDETRALRTHVVGDASVADRFLTSSTSTSALHCTGDDRELSCIRTQKHPLRAMSAPFSSDRSFSCTAQKPAVVQVYLARESATRRFALMQQPVCKPLRPQRTSVGYGLD
jgi:hypothetical protein